MLKAMLKSKFLLNYSVMGNAVYYLFTVNVLQELSVLKLNRCS